MLDVTNRVVSIDLDIGEVGAGMLCFSHAEKIVVPRGWTLVDNRSVRPPLFDGEHYEVPALPEAMPAVEVARPLVASKRRDKRRRSPLPGVAGSDDDRSPLDDDQFDLREAGASGGPTAGQIEVVVDVTTQRSGSFAPNDSDVVVDLGSYDLPAAYRDAVSTIDIDEPDRAASPLLARAFDVTRTKRRS